MTGAARTLAAVAVAIIALAFLRPELFPFLSTPELPDPCTEPIQWYVGSVDPDFGFTPVQVERAAAEAATVWDRAAQRPLFRRDTAGMAIRLVFDERQELSSERRAQRTELAELQAEVQMLDTRLQRLQDQVADRERQHLDSPTKATRETYQATVDRYNRTVQEYNRAVDRYNAAVETARQDTGAALRAGNLRTRSETRNGRVVGLQRELTVAVAGSYDELVLVLAHELGHALGLGHVDAPEALMAEEYRSDDIATPITLTTADRRALNALCAPGG